MVRALTMNCRATDVSRGKLAPLPRRAGDPCILLQRARSDSPSHTKDVGVCRFLRCFPDRVGV